MQHIVRLKKTYNENKRKPIKPPSKNLNIPNAMMEAPGPQKSSSFLKKKLARTKTIFHWTFFIIFKTFYEEQKNLMRKALQENKAKPTTIYAKGYAGYDSSGK